eukprot:COSAG05_NODE_1089_length_5920_cov_2.369009_2_plen_49_part_00
MGPAVVTAGAYLASGSTVTLIAEDTVTTTIYYLYSQLLRAAALTLTRH